MTKKDLFIAQSDVKEIMMLVQICLLNLGDRVFDENLLDKMARGLGLGVRRVDWTENICPWASETYVGFKIMTHGGDFEIMLGKRMKNHQNSVDERKKDN